ncbi:MAG: PilZ domain-containing protein [Gammaproteobacteria bacterium]|nr:PilZ domain-containing protein [Gammaproteobacteria bacterium]MDH5594918.1 PilZ domain-containing protein [Gammaproteobacteria bacterium]
MTQERRRFTRVPFDAYVQLSNIEHQWTAHLIDISLHGVLVELDTDWEGHEGDFLVVDLKLGNGEVDIHMETAIAHIHDNHLGLETKNMDLDSITHLRRLLEVNLGDAELVNRELAELGK